MKNIKSQLLIFIAVTTFLLTASCQQDEATSTVNLLATETGTKSSITQTERPISPDVPLRTPTETTIPATSDNVTEHCLSVENELPPDVHLSGKLILNHISEYSIKSFLENERVALPENSKLMAVSPNGKYLALYKYDTQDGFTVIRDVLVVNSKGDIVQRFAWNDIEVANKEKLYAYPLNPVRWLDNTTLLFSILPTGSFVAVNVETGERRKTIFPYSEDVYLDYSPATLRTAFVEYNPLLEGVIYEGSGHVFILRYLVDKNTVVWARRDNGIWADPKWSPDGEMVATAITDTWGKNGFDDMYLVDIVGNERRLTNFKEMYKDAYKILIYKIVWSPDGQRLALKLTFTKQERDDIERIDDWYAGRLIVIEPATNQIIDYCLLYGPPPIWSPDGKFIAIGGVIVDLARDRAYKVTDSDIVGWMVTDEK